MDKKSYGNFKVYCCCCCCVVVVIVVIVVGVKIHTFRYNILITFLLYTFSFKHVSDFLLLILFWLPSLATKSTSGTK